ncbi:coiled-coil domain-containing protein 82-like isoform X2 [Mixophyes fleayi]|uniref:coiled-coil domain-containing protein 82-like isoform X2 n=1 Tax=Mixophyes fleayi TaxID=3061075 RepID=UPI003F4D9B2E
MVSTPKKYYTRQRRKLNESLTKHRVDWRRTKLESSSDEEETKRNNEDSSSTGQYGHKQSKIFTGSADDREDDEDKENNPLNKDTDFKETRGKSEDGKSEAHIKKQRRSDNLKQLVEQRRFQSRNSKWKALKIIPSVMNTPLITKTFSEYWTSRQRSYFPVNSGKKVGNQLAGLRGLFKKHNIFQSVCSDLYFHLQKVIIVFLFNIVDNTFLKTLYERLSEKRYAKGLLRSLNYFKERVIAPRLQILTARCIWTLFYKNCIRHYPKIEINRKYFKKRECDACKFYRTCKFLVNLSGQAYNKRTLSNMTTLKKYKKELFVGIVCSERTKIYHQVKHYKYHLYQRCIPFLDNTKEVPARELVDIALSKMNKEKFLKKELHCLKSVLKKADLFQKETVPSLLDANYEYQ